MGVGPVVGRVAETVGRGEFDIGGAVGNEAAQSVKSGLLRAGGEVRSPEVVKDDRNGAGADAGFELGHVFVGIHKHLDVHAPVRKHRG